MERLIKLITSVCYLGFFPHIPGTISSAAAFLIFFFLRGHLIFIYVLACLSAISGFMLCGKAQRIFGKKDAPQIVIDEFFAMLAVLLLVKQTVPSMITALVIFRITDIAKFWPIRKIEQWGGGKAIMLDDCAAGVYTILAVYLLGIFF